MKEGQYKLIVDGARRHGASFPTQGDWLDFKAAIDAGFAVEAVVSPPVAEAGRFALSDPAAFFAALRKSKAMGPTLSTEEVEGCDAILAACSAARWGVAWTSDALATAHLETAGTMHPIKEYGGTAYFRRMYDIEGARPAKARELGNLSPGDGARFAGRGYVQLTGRTNYLKAGSALGHDLIREPDLAMRPGIAAAIMARGMESGWFTGKKLADYLPTSIATLEQFKAARRIINGQDRALDIARTALEFQRALHAGGWQEVQS